MDAEIAESTGRGTAQVQVPAVEHSCSQQQRRCYLYHCRRKDESPVEERERLERAGLYLARVTAEQNVLFSGGLIDRQGADLRTRLLDRPQGAMLNRLLRPGDHVVFAGTERGRVNVRNFLSLADLWRCRGVNVHVVDRAPIFDQDFTVDLGDPEQRRLFEEAVCIALDL